MGIYSRDQYVISYQESNPIKIVYNSAGYKGQKGNTITSVYEYDHKTPNNLSGSFQSLMGGLGMNIPFNVSHNLTKVTQTVDGTNPYKNLYTFNYTYDSQGRPTLIQETETTTNPEIGASASQPKLILSSNTKLSY
jgi:hypothetical protein